MAEKQAFVGYPKNAFTFALIAGVLIVAGGIAALALLSVHGPSFWTGFRNHPWNTSGPLATRPAESGDFRPFIFRAVAAFGLVSGFIVLASAFLLRMRPAKHTTWGILILVFSVLSFFGFGGFFIGAILGIISGALALSWKPSTADEARPATA